jgi:hypothetical protein
VIAFKAEQKISRIEYYAKAKIALVNGDFKLALQIIEDILDRYGEHISLFADRATCYYFLEDVPSWLTAVQLYELKLTEISPLLSLESEWRSWLILAKFKEELGDIRCALNIYFRLLGNSSVTNSVVITLTQIVRLMSQWQIRTDLPEYYQKLLSVEVSVLSISKRTELLHALALAEAELFGFNLGILRYNKFIEMTIEEANVEDQKLFLYDFIEISLRQNHSIDRELLSTMGRFPMSSYYETCLKDLVPQRNERKFCDYSSAKLFPAQRLKLLYLVLLRRGHSLGDLMGEYIKLYVFLLELLPADSRILWLKKIQELNLSDKQQAPVWQNGQLTMGPDVLSLRNRKVLKQMLDLLYEKPEWDLELVAKKMGYSCCDEYFYQRVRIAGMRLNSLIQKKFGILKFVQVTKTRIYSSVVSC